VTDALHDVIRVVSERAPERTAIIAGARRLSYDEVTARAASLARRLAGGGFRTGECVAIVAENSPEYLITALGVWQAGGILATVYPSTGVSELAYVLENAAPRLVLVDEPRRDAVTGAVKASGVTADVHRIGEDELLSEFTAEAATPAEIDCGTAALICYTSGTSARPKPVVQSHAALAAASLLYASVWHCRNSDRTLVAVPLAWLYGLVTGSTTTLVSGGTVVLLPKFNPVHVLQAIERERVTMFPAVTTMLVKLVACASELARAPVLTSLRFCVSGGEPRNEPAFEEWRRLSGCVVHDVYAASECFPVITYDPIEDPEPRRGCAGRLVPGAEMRLVAPDGTDVQPGEVGEALWRGPGLMLGYWNEPDLTQAALTADGWYRTHDYVRTDAEGYVYVTGRVSDMIIRGGSNVSPAEVEAVLADHPDVAQAAVVGLPDPEYGEKVAAALVLEPTAQLDEEALRRFCLDRLAPYKVPSIFQRFDELPRNASGKVQRRELAPLLQVGKAAAS
jgi:long-chain acyl-CoA synthetase